MCTMRCVWSFIIVMCIYLWYVQQLIIYIHQKYMTWDIQCVTLIYEWIFSVSRERNY